MSNQEPTCPSCGCHPARLYGSTWKTTIGGKYNKVKTTTTFQMAQCQNCKKRFNVALRKETKEDKIE